MRGEIATKVVIALSVIILKWLAKPGLVLLIRHFIVRAGLYRADINKKSVK